MNKGNRIVAIVALGTIWSLAGCGVRQPSAPILVTPAPYHLMPVDEAMSCAGIADSFAYSARRAARLEYWLDHGPIASFGTDRFGEDAPLDLGDERSRLDALSDLQREKGCRVSDPVAAVAYERSKYPPLLVPAPPQVPLSILPVCRQAPAPSCPHA